MANGAVWHRTNQTSTFCLSSQTTAQLRARLALGIQWHYYPSVTHGPDHAQGEWNEHRGSRSRDSFNNQCGKTDLIAHMSTFAVYSGALHPSSRTQ